MSKHISLEDLDTLASNGARRVIHDKPLKTPRFANPRLENYYKNEKPANVMVNLATDSGEGGVGWSTSEIAWKAASYRKFIDKKARQITAGLKLVPEERVSALENQWTWDTEITADYPLDEGARGPEHRVEYRYFQGRLYRAEVNFRITDETRIRGQSDFQKRRTLKRAAEALALRKDQNIINVLINGAATSVNAIDNWDDWDSPTKDVAADIAKAYYYILQNSNAQPEEIKQAKLLIPVEFLSVFMEIRLINGIEQSYQEFMSNTWGLELVPTRTYTGVSEALYDKALLVIPGENTAVHQVLIPPAEVPLAEVQRIQGVGYDFLVREWYNTILVPEEQGGTTNYRIYAINNIRE